MFFSQQRLSSVRSIENAATRPALARRLGRVRFAWFVLGAAFGVGAGYYIFSSIHHNSEYGKQLALQNRLAQLDLELAPLPESARPGALALASALPQVSAAVSAIARDTREIGEQPVAASSRPQLPASYTLTVEKGDTFASLLLDKGVSQDETYALIESMKRYYNPRNLSIGQAVELHLEESKDDPGEPIVSSLSIVASPLKTINVTRNDDDRFTAKEINAPVTKSLARAGGPIHSSFYQTGADAGIPAKMLAEIIQAFTYDVDFQRDLREGDVLDVVFERMHTDDNATAGYGKVVYASLKLGDDEFTLYRHVSPDGFAGYYNAKGESVKKALLKTPINGAQITSGFGMRMHPLLGYSKMHKGIDFGATTGTPIYAAGDGVIEEAGRHAGYGNYVRIKHSASYETAYGHASRIARGMHPGAHVKQGQVIAYVGSTGMSTGPHLHYEIMINGAQVNPSGVKFRTGQTLAGKEMNLFKHEKGQVQAALATLPRRMQVASLENR